MKVDAVNPVVTEVDQTTLQMLSGSWRERPAYWEPAQHMMQSKSSASINVMLLPQPPRLPSQVSSGGHVAKEALKLGSVTLRQKLYKGIVAVDKYSVLNPAVGAAQAVVENYASSLSDELLAVEAGKVLASNPTMSRIDGATFFYASHPVNPFNPSFKNPVTGSAVQANLLTSAGFSHTALIAALTAARRFVWPNGRPCNASRFTVFMPLGNSLDKAAHLLYGDILGGNFTSSMVSGAADVGSNSNVWKASKERFGTEISLAGLPEYTGTSTDWFLGTGILKPFFHVESVPFHGVKIMDEELPSVQIDDEYQLITVARFALGLSHPLALIKNTA